MQAFNVTQQRTLASVLMVADSFFRSLIGLSLLVFNFILLGPASGAVDPPDPLLRQLGVTRGIVVVLGDRRPTAPRLLRR